MMMNGREHDVFNVYINARIDIPVSNKTNLKVDQQPTEQGLILHVGTTVRYHDNTNKKSHGTMRLCSVIGINQEMEITRGVQSKSFK